MTDGKLDGLASDDDDPFEGIQLSADAPEPTQEEMDEWATLDTPDEGSPLSTRNDTKGSGLPATASSAAEPAQQTSAERAKKDEKPVAKEEPKDAGKNADTTPASATQPSSEGPSAAVDTVPAAATTTAQAPPAVPAVSVAAPPVELSEITPSQSPVPFRIVPDKNAALEDDSAENPLFGGGDGKPVAKSDQAQQRQQPQQPSGGGWGGGWGTSWGLGALGGKLREVAAGAVRDVKDLTETFQAALADVTGSEEEVERARLLSEMDRASESMAQVAQTESEALDQPADVPSGPLPTDAPRQLSEPARELGAGGAAAGSGSVGRSAGGSASVRGSAGGAAEAGGSGVELPADPALEAGLQAIDAQVEQLATGAARAFTSLWGGLSSVAKVVAAEVAASVADVQHSEAVRGVAQIGTKLAHTAERGLETVGRTAMTLLEEVAGVGGAAGARRRIWGEEADARAADMGREPSSFQDFFYIYGGEQLAEEVNNLSNECSHLCNRSRSKLEADQQQALDEALARLGPYFNDPGVSPRAGGAPGEDTSAADTFVQSPSSGVPTLEEGSKEAAERLGHMYDPIGYLCQDSLSRSEAYLHQLGDAIETARQEKRGAGDKKRAASKSTSPDAEEKEGLLDAQRREEAAAKEAEAEAEGEAEWQKLQVDPQPLLDSFRAHFTKRLAEVATAQLQLLLNLGASLAAPARTGRPAVDGITWPPSSEQQAALLATEARRMVADLATIADAYRATITALRSQLKAAAPPAKAAATAPAETAEAEGSAPAATTEEAKGTEAASSAGAAAHADVVDPAVLEELDSSLVLAAESASAAIKSGYKGLLYAVLLRRLVTQIAQQEEEEEEAVKLPAGEDRPEALAPGGDVAEDEVAEAAAAVQ